MSKQKAITAVLLTAVTIAGLALIVRNWPRPEPATLVNRAVRAAGGVDALRELCRGGERDGIEVSWLPFPYATHWSAVWIGADSLQTWRHGPFVQKLCVQGVRSWESIDGVAARVTPYYASRYHEEILQPFFAAALLRATRRGIRIEDRGWSRLPDGANTRCVEIWNRKGDALRQDLYFDPASGRLEAISYKRGRSEVLYRSVAYQELRRASYASRFDIYINGKKGSTFSVTARTARVKPIAFPPPAESPGIGHTIVPLLPNAARPYVMVSINGSPPARFLVDTGEAMIVLFAATARKLNLRQGAPLRCSARFANILAHAYRVRSVRVGTTRVWVRGIR